MPKQQPSQHAITRALLDLRQGQGAPADLRWLPLQPGVTIARLYGDGVLGPSAAYLRYLPGARVPRHEHPGYEHIFVLEGSQSDDEGSYRPGQCLIHGPGSSHRVWSDPGCLVLAVWTEPVRFLE